MDLAQYIGVKAWELDDVPLKWLLWYKIHKRAQSIMQQGLQQIDE